MAKMELFVIGCVLALIISPIHSDEEASDVMEKVQAAVEVGDAILEILTDEDTAKFSKQIVQFASKIAPFFGAIGPMISIITLFLPDSPSPEMQYMKEQFAKMDAKFDQVFHQIGQLENLLMESSIKCQYSEYVLTILSLSNKLNVFLNQSHLSSETFKIQFMDEYETTYGGATWKLYEGMMGESVLLDNIPLAAMEFTDNHRRKTQQLMKGVINLIMQGVKVVLAYHKFKGNDASVDSLQTYWEDLIQTLLDHVIDMDKVVMDRWQSELEEDIDSKLATWFELSNEEYAEQLYNFLNEKYDWRDWHVVAYNDLDSSDEHYVSQCGGNHRFGKHGRNLVVASALKNTEPKTYDAYTMNNVNMTLQFVRPKECHNGWATSSCKTLNAKGLYDQLPEEMKADCQYPSVGVIDEGADITHKAPPNRLVTLTKGDFEIYVFYI